MIVFDASAAVTALLSDGTARRLAGSEQLHVPHLVDAEVAQVLRRQVAAARLDRDAGWRALDRWCRLAMTRYPVFLLAERIWQLRENLTAYDAAYVALAESLGCALVTSDARLSRAAGLRCPVTVLPPPR